MKAACIIRVSSDERSECLGIALFSTFFLAFFSSIFFVFFSRALTKHFFAYLRGRGESFQGAEGLLDLLAGVLTHFRPFSGPNSHFHTFSPTRDPWGNNRLAENAENEDKIDDNSDENP